MEAVDRDLFKNLKWVLENDPKDLELDMTCDHSYFGKQEEIELVEGGKNIPVTNANKKMYVKRMCHVKLTDSIKEQLEKFQEGFYEVIPQADIAIFDEAELELLMC